MISKATTQLTVAAIIRWQGSHQVSDEAVLQLLTAIAAVPGNKSFAASVKELIDEYEAML